MCANRLPVTQRSQCQKKWSYSSPFKKTMKNKNPNFVLPPMTEAPFRAAKSSGSQTKLLVLFSHHIWCAMLSGPSYPLPSHQACQAQPLGGRFTWSNIHSNQGAAHLQTDFTLGLIISSKQLEFVYRKYVYLYIGDIYFTYSVERRIILPVISLVEKNQQIVHINNLKLFLMENFTL